MPVNRSVVFTAPMRIELQESSSPTLQSDEVLVETICSAISPGTEKLIYQGKFPKNISDTNDLISSSIDYPICYGYANVGRIRQVGNQVKPDLNGRMVFAFQPHTSLFSTNPEKLLFVPADVTPEDACLLPFVETALNTVQDASPLVGEKALVLGQGIIGLLVTAILDQFPLDKLVTTDYYALRRKASRAISQHVTASLDPMQADYLEKIESQLNQGADLTIECTGNPVALNHAIRSTAYSGRVIIASWYGENSTPLDLGSTFHRSRIKLISSQVSTIAPELSGRWDKERRFNFAWKLLAEIKPGKWITHRFKQQDCAQAYELICDHPDESIQVILTYS
ncbi:MAG: hypothetical protein A2Y54_07740 [Chloroflexi bacterium RBG_16_51_16]|nr:MAG: hypothetical protein A2Y54_07740 [Chloroflexi bacterium RBG_16_51_16]